MTEILVPPRREREHAVILGTRLFVVDARR